jgi:hypothetical protein
MMCSDTFLCAGGVAQVIEGLPRKCEALSSSPNTAIKKTTNPSLYETLNSMQKVHNM